MNKEMTFVSWNGFAASVPGAGHIRHGIPCQDASAVQLGEYPAVIVCDGRGSAKLSHFGAQEAVAAFKRQTAILTPFLSNILDDPEATPEKWDKFCKIVFRTLMQVKLDLAETHDCSEKEFDFTVALAVAGKEYVGCFQVGDGALVLWEDGKSTTVFTPDKGEFTNQTRFLRLGGENNNGYHAKLFPADKIEGISATSDGPEHLMFHLETMTPGRIFDQLFSDLAENELCRQDLMDYLTRKEWNNDPRGTDDRSIAIIAKIKNTELMEVDGAEDISEKIYVEHEVKVNEIDVQPESAPELQEDRVSSQKKETVPTTVCNKCNKPMLLCCITTLFALSVLSYCSWTEYKMVREMKNKEKIHGQTLSNCLNQLNALQRRLDIHLQQLNEIKMFEYGVEKFSTAETEILPEAGAIPANSTNFTSLKDEN